jgi:hypothetical protein
MSKKSKKEEEKTKIGKNVFLDFIFSVFRYKGEIIKFTADIDYKGTDEGRPVIAGIASSSKKGKVWSVEVTLPNDDVIYLTDYDGKEYDPNEVEDSIIDDYNDLIFDNFLEIKNAQEITNQNIYLNVIYDLEYELQNRGFELVDDEVNEQA